MANNWEPLVNLQSCSDLIEAFEASLQSRKGKKSCLKCKCKHWTTHTNGIPSVAHSGMIRDHLMEFYKLTRQKPHWIIFFRVDVSEGQFSRVMSGEMNQIRKACVSLEEKYMPRITFTVGQKRHHTRLFADNHNDKSLTDKSGNLLPANTWEPLVNLQSCSDVIEAFEASLQSRKGKKTGQKRKCKHRVTPQPQSKKKLCSHAAATATYDAPAVRVMFLPCHRKRS